jgi:hypothetical protein
MAKRITDAMKRQIREQRARGLSIRQVAAIVGIGRSAVSAILAEPSGSPPEPGTHAPEMSEDGVRAALLRGFAEATAAADAARARGDAAAAASWMRVQASYGAELRKSREAEPDRDGTWVTDSEMAIAADRARTRMKSYVLRRSMARANWPKCPTCQQPVEPKND